MGVTSITLLGINSTHDIYVETFVNPYPDSPAFFNEVEINVNSPTKVVNGPSAGVEDKEKTIKLVTVVKK